MQSADASCCVADCLAPCRSQPHCSVAFADVVGPSEKYAGDPDGKLIVRESSTLVWADDGEFPGSTQNYSSHILTYEGKDLIQVALSILHAEPIVCMRIMEMCPPSSSALTAMMEIDDPFELASGQKCIQCCKSQRLVIAAIRQLDMMMKLRANIKVIADDMAALPLTKPIYKQNEFDEEVVTRSTRRLGSFSLGDAELDSLWCSTSSTPSSQDLSGMD